MEPTELLAIFVAILPVFLVTIQYVDENDHQVLGAVAVACFLIEAGIVLALYVKLVWWLWNYK